MKSGPVRQAILFIGLLLLQVLVVRNIVLFGTAFAYVYVLALLLLPVDTSRVYSMLIGFGIGLLMDIFSNTGGMHAAACVAIMFVRERWLNMITPQGGYELGAQPSLAIGGVSWFSAYAFPLILLHHIILFFLESYGFSMFWFTLNKVFFSSIFTFTLCMVILLLTGRSGR